MVLIAASPVSAAGQAKVTGQQAKQTVHKLPAVIDEMRQHPGSHTDVELQTDRWRVQVWSKQGSLLAEVFIAADRGDVLEQYTGYKAAWGMARGRPGAFGHDATALWVWLPLVGLFLLPFLPRGRPRLRHIDLAAVAGLSVSIAFFNRGEIELSTPLLYPPMLWLLGRMLWRGFRGSPLRKPDTSLLSGRLLLLGTVFLIGFRIAFIAANGNVIDVGDASVVGARLLADGKPVYNHFPERIVRGDTYGPVTYELYAPFAALLGGTTENHNEVPAKVAAIIFDLLAMALLTGAAYRLRGPPLALLTAWFWVTCPFTLYVAMCSANDALPAALIALALLASTLAAGRGALARGGTVMLTALSKMVGLVLIPLFSRVRGSGGRGALIGYTAGALLMAALILTPFVSDLPAVWERTLGYQDGRGAPFSAWGLYPIPELVRQVWMGAVVAFAASLAFFPRSSEARTLPRVAALAAAVLIAAELSAVYWFYTYIVWFLPAIALAVLPDWTLRVDEPVRQEAAAAQ